MVVPLGPSLRFRTTASAAVRRWAARPQHHGRGVGEQRAAVLLEQSAQKGDRLALPWAPRPRVDQWCGDVAGGQELGGEETVVGVHVGRHAPRRASRRCRRSSSCGRHAGRRRNCTCRGSVGWTSEAPSASLRTIGRADVARIGAGFDERLEALGHQLRRHGAMRAGAWSSLRAIALARATWRHTPDHSAMVRPSWVMRAAGEGEAARHLQRLAARFQRRVRCGRHSGTRRRCSPSRRRTLLVPPSAARPATRHSAWSAKVRMPPPCTPPM